MRYQRITLSVLTLITITILTPVISGLSVPLGGLIAWGQTADSEEVKADRFLQQGKKLYNKDKFQNDEKT